MSDIFLVLEHPYIQVIAWIVQQCNAAGFQVVNTFDLRNARHAEISCPCPHHGTEQCDCQMVVLLVYADSFEPASLVVHSHDGRTWISLVDTQQQKVDPYLESSIRQVLAQEQPGIENLPAFHPNA